MYEIETPALLLHLDVVERNVRSMADRARRLGVTLRPHAKTHKCVPLGRLQLEHGARGLTVATTVEAAVFARAGVRDLTDRKSTRLNSSHSQISYAVFCLKKKKTNKTYTATDKTTDNDAALHRH